MMILIWVLIGFAIYYLVTENKADDSKNKSSKKDPVEALKLRYVSGEIDEETYRRTLKVLND